MEAWTDLKQIATHSRIQERTREAAADRLARAATHMSTVDDRIDAAQPHVAVAVRRDPLTSRS